MLGYFGGHFENSLMKFCSYVLSITIIVTALFFTLISPLLRVILGYLWAQFCGCFSFFENHLIFSHEISYICSWYYSGNHNTKNNFSCCPPLVGAILGYFWAHFGVWSSISWELFNFLSWNVEQIFKKLMAPFYGWGSTRAQQLMYVAYVCTSTFIGVRMNLDKCTLTHMLIFSLWFFKVFKNVLVFTILYWLKTYCYIFHL